MRNEARFEDEERKEIGEEREGEEGNRRRRGDEKQKNGRGAEDFRGGSKNTENAPLFSGSTRICIHTRVYRAHEGRTRKRGALEEGERDRESERKAVVARGPESAREQLERIVFTRGMTG